MLARGRRGGGAARLEPGPAPTRPRWIQRLDAARSIVAWVDEEPARAPAIGAHPALSSLGGLDGALTYLHRRWVTAFGVALDQELEYGSPLGAPTLARVRRRMADEEPGLTGILQHFASHPAVRAGRDHHRRLLSDVTGGPTEGG